MWNIPAELITHLISVTLINVTEIYSLSKRTICAGSVKKLNATRTELKSITRSMWSMLLSSVIEVKWTWQSTPRGVGYRKWLALTRKIFRFLPWLKHCKGKPPNHWHSETSIKIQWTLFLDNFQKQWRSSQEYVYLWFNMRNNWQPDTQLHNRKVLQMVAIQLPSTMHFFK